MFRARVSRPTLGPVIFRFKKSNFPFQKKVKFRFDSVSLLAMLNSMKSQYIERKCGERTVKMAQLVR